MEQRVDPPEDIATALFYGIESEMTGYPREATPQDDGALLYLYQYASKDLLAEIKSARLPISYFETLIQALQNSFIYDHLIMAWAGDLAQPESAAEIADFLIRFEEVEALVMCVRRVREQLDHVSADRACQRTGRGDITGSSRRPWQSWRP